MSQPPDSSESSSPRSERRANDVYEVCDRLSSDGAAAVLLYARTLLEKDRRYPPTLQMVAVWNFSWTVEIAAREMKEGVHRSGLVFIAAVYRFLRARGDAATMTLPAFKARCLEAQAARFMILESCRNTEGVAPLLLEASATQGEKRTFHLIRRSPITSVRLALEQVINMLPPSARQLVAIYARRVRTDEALREGRPRLITLSPEKFAARVQEVVNEDTYDIPITKLFWKLEERGEMTGIDLDSFKARLVAAHRAGRLRLGTTPTNSDASFFQPSVIQDQFDAWSVVRRSNTPPPIPWGPPARPIVRKLVLHAP